MGKENQMENQSTDSRESALGSLTDDFEDATNQEEQNVEDKSGDTPAQEETEETQEQEQTKETGSVQEETQEYVGKQFKTLKDAEDAYLTQRSYVDRVAQENAQLKKQLESVQTDPVAQVVDNIQQKISKLDPEDVNYQKKAAMIWAQGQAEISQITVNNSRAQEAKISEINENVKAAGLGNYIQEFWKIARSAPPNLDVEKCVEWTMDTLKGIIAKSGKTVKQQKDAVLQNRKNTTVLGKGTNKTVVVQNRETGSTLTDDIREFKKSRTYQPIQ